MNGITIWMALVDTIPVVFFLLATMVLIKDFGAEADKGKIMDYTFISGGALMLFGGAMLKLGWKFAYALNICDYYTLTESFFPMQTIGFAMLGMGVLGYLRDDNKKAIIARSIFGGLIGILFVAITIMFTSGAKAEAVLEANQVLPYESHMPFLLCTFIGFMVTLVAFMVIAFRRKAKVWAIAFFVCVIFFIVQAITGSMFDGTPGMHWIAQCSNIVAQSALWLGTKGIYKAKK